MRPPSRVVRLLIVLAITAGCGDSPSPTDPSTTTTATTTEVYAGTMAPGGSGFFSFRVINPGVVSITLASLTASASGLPLSAPMAIGMGVPAGEGCAVTTSMTVTPGLRAQLMSQAGAHIYCVQLSDIGNLTTTVAFGVRIVHP